MKRIIFDVPRWSIYLHRESRGLDSADRDDTPNYSLILLQDELAAKAPERTSGRSRDLLEPKPQSRGVGFLEFAVNEAKASDLAELFGQLGFRKTGQHRSKAVERWSQGKVELVINCEADGFAHSHYITHGPGVCAIALDVDKLSMLRG